MRCRLCLPAQPHLPACRGGSKSLQAQRMLLAGWAGGRGTERHGGLLGVPVRASSLWEHPE